MRSSIAVLCIRDQLFDNSIHFFTTTNIRCVNVCVQNVKIARKKEKLLLITARVIMVGHRVYIYLMSLLRNRNKIEKKKNELNFMDSEDEKCLQFLFFIK